MPQSQVCSLLVGASQRRSGIRISCQVAVRPAEAGGHPQARAGTGPVHTSLGPV